MEEDRDLPFPQWLIEIGQNEMWFYEVIRPLIKYCFVRQARGRKSYSIHPLVHRWASLRMEDDFKRRSMLSTAFSLITNNVPNYNVPDSSALEVRLSPHIRCARSSKHFDAISCARAFNNVSILYRNQGRFADAKAMCLKAQKLRLAELGPNHVLTLKSECFLANIDRKLGLLQQSKLAFERIIPLCREHLGAHEHTSRTCYDAALLYVEFGHFSLALTLYNVVIAARREILGPNSLKYLQSIGSQGNAYADLHQLDKAEKCYTTALEGKLELVGKDHRTTMFTLDNLGILHAHQGKLNESERELNTVLAFRAKNLGVLHTSTLRTYQHLGELYTKMGDLVRADEMLHRALEGHKIMLGCVHQEYRGACTAYGALREAQVRFSEAEEFYAQVLAQRMEVFGLGNYHTREAWQDLDRVRRLQGNSGLETLPDQSPQSSLSTESIQQISTSPADMRVEDSPASDCKSNRARRSSLWSIESGGRRPRAGSIASLNSPKNPQRPTLWFQARDTDAEATRAVHSPTADEEVD